jgi:hypothetical protein
MTTKFSSMAPVALDTCEFQHVSLDHCVQVGVEERGAATGRTTDRLREPTDHDPLEVVPAAQLRGVTDARAVREQRVHEPVGRAGDLSLRERPEFDDLHPSGQGVRKRAQCENPRRAGQQEPAWGGVEIDCHLDGLQQVGCELNLIDHQESVVLDKAAGVVHGSAQGGRIIQQADDRPGQPGGCQPGERALAGLAGTVDEHHPGVGQCFRNQPFGVPGNQLSSLSHPS